jgi:succinate dehydrogenase/fumarate reductase flavoprotein subunit
MSQTLIPQFDVAIVGFGVAGASAPIAAAETGAADRQV